MYSKLRKILTSALIAVLMLVMVFQSAMAEEQTPAEEPSPAAVQAAEKPEEPAREASQQPSAEPESRETPSVDEQPAQEEPAVEPEAQAALEPAAEPEAQATLEPEADAAAEQEELDAATEEQLLVEIPDEQVPLAGGDEPSVTVRANCDINSLQIGDRLVLTCELSGFSGMEYEIRWQARVDRSVEGSRRRTRGQAGRQDHQGQRRLVIPGRGGRAARCIKPNPPRRKPRALVIQDNKTDFGSNAIIRMTRR